MRYKISAAGRNKLIIFAVVVGFIVISIILFIAVALPAFSTALKEAQTELAASLKNGTYESSTMKISYQQYKKDGLSWYIADIEPIPGAALKTAFANDSYGEYYLENPLSIATKKNAVIAIPGDRYAYSDTGLVIREGKLYRCAPADHAALLIYNDGSMKVIAESDVPDEAAAQALIDSGVVNSFSSGPTLISGGKRTRNYSSIKNANEKLARSGIGITKDGHYIIIIVDAVSRISAGTTLSGLEELFYQNGCTDAYALCTGADAMMIFEGEVVTGMEGRTSPRAVCDLIYFAE